MTVGDTPTPRQVVSRNLAQIRAKVGLSSAQDLADRIKVLGGRLDRAAISKIETGTRNVSLDDLVMLAAALDVAPAHLMTPLAAVDPVQVVPGAEAVAARKVRDWIKGVQPLAFTDARTYRSAWLPDEEFTSRSAEVAAALRRESEAEHRVRVARTLLDTISDDLSEAAPLGFLRTVDPRRDAQKRDVLERNLTLAYDRLAEAKVELEDARAEVAQAREAAQQ